MVPFQSPPNEYIAISDVRMIGESCLNFGDPEYKSTLVKCYDELKSDGGDETPDIVQNDDSSSEIDMNEGNEEEDGEDSVGVVLIDHHNDKNNNEANDDEKDQSTSNKKNPSLEKWSSAPISRRRKTPAKD
ncbi:hypothetical protein HHI36_004991 [Cryptolaemus montrouzieri]|uniref:Uncharacterized protein n=1 Tax=Cryptolaemus montrouzieri TaxID=559131 RepID=A0ABD2NT13_9CUCU